MYPNKHVQVCNADNNVTHSCKGNYSTNVIDEDGDMKVKLKIEMKQYYKDEIKKAQSCITGALKNRMLEILGIIIMCS